MRKKTDVVIIGAGIMGVSLSYHLSKLGKDVVVIEKGEICSGTSSTTAAWLWPSDETPEAYGRLAKESFDMYLTLANELGIDFELNMNGSLDIAHTEKDLAEFRELMEYDRMLGYKCRMLDSEELYREEPNLAPGLLGGYMVESDGSLNPFLLIKGYVTKAMENGVEYNTYTTVTGFEREGSQISAVVTDKGTIEADIVVCAAGIYSKKIAAMLGLNAHLYSTRGFVLITEKLPPLFNHMVNGARQSKSGEIVLGFNSFEADPDNVDRNVYLYGMKKAAEDALMDFPILNDVNIIRSYSGTRVHPEDDIPILGPSGEIDNFWFHIMHNAYASSPAASKNMAEMICGVRNPETMAAFAYTRFEQS